MTQPDDAQTHDEFKAVVYVGTSAVLYSLVPLTIDSSGSHGAPLTVGAGIVIGFLVYSATMRRIKYPATELSYLSLIKRFRTHHVSKLAIILLLVVGVINVFGYVAFSWSTAYLDTAVSSSLYELWPIVWFLCMKGIDARRHEEFMQSRISAVTYFLLVVGASGVSLVVYSTYTPNATERASSLLLGVVLALCAPVLGG